jgi:uncharacterized membrane protein YfcA
MMRGSKKNPSIINITKCGTLDWGLFMGFILINIAVFYAQVVRVQREEQIKKVTKIGRGKSDIEFSGNTLKKLVLVSLAGGFVGAVGLGGGIVFNPVLIGMGVQPQVTASTGMYMILFSAFSNTLSFWLFGNLDVMYALWIGAWTAVGIYVFLSIIGGMIKKYRRPSIVVFFLGGVIGLSSIVVPAVNTMQLV